MIFEWDSRKAERNQRKHNVTFTIISAFLLTPNERKDYEEIS
jgi:uncharacterized DUF497 family protein